MTLADRTARERLTSETATREATLGGARSQRLFPASIGGGVGAGGNLAG